MRLAFLFLILPLYALAQTPIDFQAFLAKGMAAINVPVNSTTQKVRFPWIEDLEVRTQTRDFQFRQQEYSLRISPSSPGIRKTRQAYYQYLAALPNFEEQEVYCDRLKEIHDDWVALFLIQEQLTLLAQLHQIQTDQQTVMNRLMGSLDFDLDKLARLRMNQTELAIRQHDLQLEQSALFEKYQVSSTGLSFDQFILIENIEQALLMENATAFTDAELSYEMGLIQKELALENAENRQWLDFVQFRYRGPHEDFFEERFSVGLGLQLPYSGNQQLKTLELELEADRKQQEIIRETQNIENEQLELKQQLLHNIERFHFFQEQIAKEAIQLKQISDSIAATEGFNPLVLLEIAERKIDTTKDLLQLKEAILNDYLDYLEKTGSLCSTPNASRFLEQN